MNILLVKVFDEKRNEMIAKSKKSIEIRLIENIDIDSNIIYIYSINISKKYINKLKTIDEKEKIATSFLKKIVVRIHKKYITYAFKNKTYVSKIMKDKSYILDIVSNQTVEDLETLYKFLNSFNMHKYVPRFNVLENIYEYVKKRVCKDECKTNDEEKNRIYNLKCVLMYNKYIYNRNLLLQVINTFKTVDIYSTEEVNYREICGIEKFNDEEGTTITILDSDTKRFHKYDVFLCSKVKLCDIQKYTTKNVTYCIDLDDISNDYLNKKYIYMKNKLQYNDKYKKLCKEYLYNYSEVLTLNLMYDLTIGCI